MLLISVPLQISAHLLISAPKKQTIIFPKCQKLKESRFYSLNMLKKRFCLYKAFTFAIKEYLTLISAPSDPKN